jgi:hypothetical protein
MEKLGGIELLAILIGIILTIMMIVAILKLPKIARYHEATMKLTALIAKQEGIDIEAIRRIVYLADKEILNDPEFEKHLDA